MDNGLNDPLMGGDPSLHLTGGLTIRLGGGKGGGQDDCQGGGERATIGGGRWGPSTIDGQDDRGDATSLAPLLLLSSSLSSAIAEENVAGGSPSSANADLDAIPADKEDAVDVDDDRAMVAAVIATSRYNGRRQREGGDQPSVVVVDATFINSNITSNEYIFF